jgi:hypothetical protein
MRRGPVVLGLLVVVALAAFSTRARASEGDSNEEEFCMRGEPEVLRSEAPTPPAPAPSLPSDAQLCVRGGFGLDCQMHDPAQRPVPPSPSTHTSPDLASAAVPALPELESARAPLPPAVLGAPRPGFDRELYRPPRA